jgi:hypothetical protein
MLNASQTVLNATMDNNPRNFARAVLTVLSKTFPETGVAGTTAAST